MALLSDAEIDSGLAGLDGWRREPGEPASIARDFEFPDFAAALAFVDRVGGAAEAANHHPDILLHGWNKVRLTYSTHSEGGLTAADFAQAASVSELV
jgi:4a-hydroxytetrahydrobiopterin dehydratase